MSKSIGYKPTTPNTNKGLKTHGKFGNSGQKSGKHGANGSKPAKEKLASQDSHTFMKKVVKGMRAEGTKLRRINMLPNSGAFH